MLSYYPFHPSWPRRKFLLATAGLVQAAVTPSILVHEHILVDFVGADRIHPGRYERDEVFRLALPRLQAVKALGCHRLLECTPNFLGRDPELLANLADAAGLQIWSNTGLYGAANHKFLPGYVHHETAEQLAKRWIAEAKAPWRPRFIKIGVNRAPLHELDRKLVKSAAIASRATGLTIASHTADGAAALQQLEILTADKLHPSKFVWVHAQSERDHQIHEQVAKAGAWVEFDNVSPRTADFHLQCVRHMAAKGLLRRTLISQDSGWYHVGEPNGGEFRGYTYLYESFLPRLEPGHVPVLMWDNPRSAFGS